MKIERMTEIETTDIRIGDRVHIGNYTATCQEIMPKGALFLMDQYINKSGELKSVLQSEEVLNIFKDIREHMVPFDNGDLLKAPFGYGWSACDRIRFRPVFLISMKKEDATKKSVPENEETIQDVLNTFNEKQRLVLNYLVGKAVKDAKKGKTSESDEDEFENDNTEHLTSTGFPDCGAGMREGNNE